MGIGNGHLKEEPKNISVELPTLHPHMVVPTQLIVPVNSSHVGIVEGHCCVVGMVHFCEYHHFLSYERCLTAVAEHWWREV